MLIFSDGLALFAGDFNLHFLHCAVFIHFNQSFLVPAIKVVTNVDEPLLDHLKFLLALSVIKFALGIVLLLDAYYFSLVLLN